MGDLLVDKLSKTVGDKTVFKDISFIIHDFDRVGIIGVNGTGKTTLLDVLSEKIGFDGDLSPISKAKDYKMAYLTQNPLFDDSHSVLDTVLSSDLPEMKLIRHYEFLMADYSEARQEELEKLISEMDRNNVWSLESEVKTVLSKLGITNLQQKVGELSGGMRRRVQLAQVLLGSADLLLLDEPTNHLDIDTINWLTNYLKTSKKTVLFITHDRYFLDSLATRIFELDNAQLHEYHGNYQDYVRLKAEQDERDAANLHKKRRLYKQELSWMRRQPQARATKQEARINRFHQLKNSISDTTDKQELDIHFETSRIGKKVLLFENLSFGYDSQKPLIKDFNLIIQNKDRIGIIGENGVGKSTLLHLINGDLEATSGRLEIGETIKVGYFSQQIKDMDDNKRLITYLQEIADEVKTSNGRISISDLLEQFLFPRSSHGKLISKLSGGEKKRLYLLKILIEKPNVLLLDEPTNDLDIATLTVLENFLHTFAGPVITVSHDRYFLDKVATKLLSFENGQILEYHGNYSDYLDEKAFQETKNTLVEKKAEQVSTNNPAEKRKMSYLERQEWASIEDTIFSIESKIEDIQAEMQRFSSNYDHLAQLQAQLDELNINLMEKYERYEYLSDLGK
ncbi:ABC-F family ATP-binding cassette domain-containing protein [Streptococcus didelphis]|uniref:ABC-F family ATP-binding cassette domain-containing protein n=2 Tax=Streptococcus didelphis TaxID=102886 RepID=UPI000368A700|nr:ABC-F family ATP-binding cassette domain-containing protein [Streptococcus didelphis]